MSRVPSVRRPGELSQLRQGDELQGFLVCALQHHMRGYTGQKRSPWCASEYFDVHPGHRQDAGQLKALEVDKMKHPSVYP